ncbi:MAG: T9SS type A sorting domain-containing protein, partial [Bacteroidales bacterium]|nr:T9SS type A sorting domain-containing protein [Bacteroidales bacterium]
EDNDFVRMLTTQDTIYGIICDNTGNAENFIRRNDFSNLFYGCYSLKNNGPIANRSRGLQFNCNSYTANTYDIYVPANSTIRNVQGSSNKGADNDFSNTLTRSLTIPMTMNTLSYYYSSGNSHIPVGTSNYTGYGTATANPCASTLCGLQNPGFPPGIIRYASLSEEYELLSDKFERRSYAEVLSDRENHPESEVQDAMAAESRLDALSVEMAELSNRGIKAVIQDSVMDFSQLKDWLGLVNTLSAKYLLVETHYLTGDYAAANRLLSALPDMFDMSEGEQEEYGNYRAFHALRNTLAGDPVLSGGASVRRNWAELSELELAELQRIAESTSGRTATMAQGILCFFYHICYEDDMALNLGDIGKRSLGGDAQDRRTRCVPTDNGLAIYPNPADGTLTVESASPIREITVYDLSGRVMMTAGGNGTASVETTHALSLRQDINVSSLPAGIYLLRVVTEKGVETGRFVKN